MTSSNSPRLKENTRLANAVLSTVAQAAFFRASRKKRWATPHVFSGRDHVLPLPPPPTDALSTLCQLKTGKPDLKILPMGPAAANSVVLAKTAAGSVVVKTRRDPNDPFDEELWALSQAPNGVTPEVLAGASHEALIATAISGRDFDAAVALDALPTQSIVMRAVPGVAPRADDPKALGAIARSLSTLHSVRPKKGPPIRAGRSLASCVRLCQRIAADLTKARVLSSKDGKAVESILNTWRRCADALLDANRVHPVLCHGDLRLHNTLVHRGRATLIDFEHAGLSDPALDIALFRARTPLNENAELLFVDAYLDASFRPRRKEQRFFLDRYRLAKDIALGLSGLAAAADVMDVVTGRRRITTSVTAFVDDKRQACGEDLSEAFGAQIEPRFNLDDEGHHATDKRRSRANNRAAPKTDKAAAKKTAAKKTAPKKTARKSTRAANRPASVIVALDGTSASGKSVLAREAARYLRCPWKNTGAAFRLFALRGLELGLSPNHEDGRDIAAKKIVKAFGSSHVELTDDGAVTLDGARYEMALEVFEVEDVVAQWAQCAVTRAFLKPVLQRAIDGGGVLEGRALTTDWCADAPVRAFVDASLDVRAKRAHARLWQSPGLGVVKRMLDRRDRCDEERMLDPAVRAKSVKLLDTTRSSEATSIAMLTKMIDRADVGRRGSQ